MSNLKSRVVDRALTADLVLQTLLDNTGVVIIVRDLDKRWVMANRDILKQLGVTQETVTGKSDFDLFPAEDARRYSVFWDQVLATSKRVKFEETAVFPGDISITYTVEAFPIYDATNSLKGFIAVAPNITDYESREQATKREVLRTKQANERLDAFAYTVSHDLRSPLRAISGFANVLERKHGDCLPEEAIQFLEKIDRGVDEMALLIDDLLDFSRIDRLEPDHKRVDLNQLVGQLVANLEPETNGAQCQISVGQLPDCVGDPALLKHVFQNLLSNAVKYTRNEQHRQIEVGWMPDDIGSEGLYFVRDNGAGFDMTYVDKLFGVFERLHHADEFEGFGIGLATTQRIVNQHGGRIWAESEVGKGATFFFTLPAEKTDQQPEDTLDSIGV